MRSKIEDFFLSFIAGVFGAMFAFLVLSSIIFN